MKTPPSKKKIFFQEIQKSLSHSSFRIRLMAYFFIFSVFLIFLSIFIFGFVLWQRYDSHAAIIRKIREKAEIEYAHKLNQLSAPMHRHLSEISLGLFRIPLKPKSDNDNQIKNLGTLDIVVLFDSPETRKWVSNNLTNIRDEITRLFTPMDRDVLLTQEGKIRLKTLITKKLNQFLPKGFVQEIYFESFIIS
jgi:flagellar basal body-associated protein FliL